jgi:hypothetical protein
MTVNFKNLLPTAMRPTRWGQLAQAYQTIWNDLINEKVKPILQQLDIDNATNDEIKLIFQQFGFNLSSYQGFCSLNEYYRREALTLATRILYKTTRNSFLYTMYIYNLLGDIYPLYLDTITLLTPITDWWSHNEFSLSLNILDAGEYNILYYSGETPVYGTPKESGFSTTTLDSDTFLTLDQQSNVDTITRYLLLSFKYLFVEDSTQFLSQYTLKAFADDISQVKKATEIPFFEPNLFINFNNDKSIKTTTYNDYEQSLSGVSQQSIIISGTSLSNFYKIKFGIGRHVEINNSIVSVQVSSFELLASQLVNCTHTTSEYTSGASSYVSYRKLFNYPQKLTEFSEMSLMHVSGGCLAYSTFPIVKFPTNMNSNIQLSFQFF